MHSRTSVSSSLHQSSRDESIDELLECGHALLSSSRFYADLGNRKFYLPQYSGYVVSHNRDRDLLSCTAVMMELFGYEAPANIATFNHWLCCLGAKVLRSSLYIDGTDNRVVHKLSFCLVFNRYKVSNHARNSVLSNTRHMGCLMYQDRRQGYSSPHFKNSAARGGSVIVRE